MAANRDQEAAFVREYLQDYDPKAAALRVGYSPATARNAAAWINPEHPTKPHLRREIDRALAKLSARCGISSERVLRELAAIAFSDVGRIADIANGSVKDNVDGIETAAVASVSIRDTKHGTITEIRMADKTRALELIGKHIGMFRDELTISGEVPVIVNDVPEAPEGSEKNDISFK